MSVQVLDRSGQHQHHFLKKMQIIGKDLNDVIAENADNLGHLKII